MLKRRRWPETCAWFAKIGGPMLTVTKFSEVARSVPVNDLTAIADRSWAGAVPYDATAPGLLSMIGSLLWT